MILTFMSPGWVDRAVNTAAQTATALLIVMPTSGSEWLNVAYGVGIATGMSLLRSASGSSTPSPEAIAVAGGAAAGRAAREVARAGARTIDTITDQVTDTADRVLDAASIPPAARDAIRQATTATADQIAEVRRRLGWPT